MPAAQVLGDIIGTIGNAAYTPESNSAYGARKYTPADYAKANGLNENDPQVQQLFGDKSHIWLNPEGKDITYGVENLGFNPNAPNISPGFWSKLTSSTARDVQNRNIAAETFPGQQSQALQAKVADIFGTGNAMTGSAIERAHTIGQLRANDIPFVAGVGGIDPNAMGTAANVMARANAGTPQAEADAATRKYGTIAAQNTPNALPAIANNAVNAATRVEPAKQTGEIYDYLHPGIGGSSMRIGELDPNTGRMGQVVNPAQSLSGVMFNNAFNGGQGPTIQGASGASYPSKQIQQSSPYGGIMPLGTIGQSQGQQKFNTPDWLLNKDSDLMTLDKYPEISVDRNSGRIYTKDGHDITNDPAVEPLRQAAKQQSQEEEQEAKEARHKAATAYHKAAIDRLKAEHLSSNVLSTIGRGVGNTLYDISTGGQYGRDLARGSYNLIDKGVNYLTADQ